MTLIWRPRNARLSAYSSMCGNKIEYDIYFFFARVDYQHIGPIIPQIDTLADKELYRPISISLTWRHSKHGVLQRWKCYSKNSLAIFWL